MPSPLPRTSLVDLTVDAILKLVEEQGLRENDTLPSTAELASELQVSRTVVREALAELAGQGLVKRQQGRETAVALPDASRLERLLRLRFAVNGADFAGLQDFREIIEVGAARQAAAHATDDDVRAIERQLDAMRSATTDDQLHEADLAFHRQLARAAGNDMILLTIEGISPLLMELRRRAWVGWRRSGRGVEPIVAAHARILDRVRAHDVDGAGMAMRDHLVQPREGLDHRE